MASLQLILDGGLNDLQDYALYLCFYLGMSASCVLLPPFVISFSHPYDLFKLVHEDLFSWWIQIDLYCQ